MSGYDPALFGLIYAVATIGVIYVSLLIGAVIFYLSTWYAPPSLPPPLPPSPPPPPPPPFPNINIIANRVWMDDPPPDPISKKRVVGERLDPRLFGFIYAVATVGVIYVALLTGAVFN